MRDNVRQSIIDQMQDRLEKGLPDASVLVKGGDGRYEIEASGACFTGLSRVKRQQLIYALIDTLIKDGTVHAVTIRAVAPGDAG